MTNNEKKLKFLKEYDQLCRKHKFCLSGCGCCSSHDLAEFDCLMILCWDHDVEDIEYNKEKWVSLVRTLEEKNE